MARVDHRGEFEVLGTVSVMSKVVFIHPDGSREEHQGRDGESVMRVAVDNLVEGIIGECGGDLSCATCHVFVDQEWVHLLPPCSPEEEDMLEAAAAEPTEFSRLCCQIRCDASLDGLTVTIPDVQR